jgi:membrane associated rhomboid family serine protease
MGIPQPRRSTGWSDSAGFDFGRMRYWSLTYWLIAINVVVFAVDVFGGGLLSNWGAFTIQDGLFRGQVWRFVTCMFLHATPGHLFFNMLGLYFFGGIVEGRLGRKRYLAFYVICGICGVLFYMALWRLRFLVGPASVGLVGASAAIFGVLIGVLYVAPGMVVRLLLPPVALTMRTFALLYIVLAVAVVLLRGPNAGGEAAHLGGALGGWILITNPRWLNAFDREKRKASRFWRPGDPASKFFKEERR